MGDGSNIEKLIELMQQQITGQKKQMENQKEQMENQERRFLKQLERQEMTSQGKGVCGDYSVTVNPQLAVHRHPLPLPEELMRKLGGGYGFTKIDLADAYNQVRLGPESRKRLALSTHRGVL